MLRSALTGSRMMERAVGVQFRRHVDIVQVQKALDAERNVNQVFRDGFVQVSQLEYILKKQGCNLSKDQLGEVIASMDANCDGRVSINEFRNFLYPVDFDASTEEEYMPECAKRELASL